MRAPASYLPSVSVIDPCITPLPMFTLVLEEESERVKVSVISTTSSFMTTLERLKHVLLVTTDPAGMMRVLCISVKSWTAVQCMEYK